MLYPDQKNMLANHKPKSTWIISRGLLTFALAILLYFPTFDFKFTNWDDDIYVTKNSLIHGLTHDRIARIFTTFQLVNYHPLTLLSYMIQYHWFHQNPAGYHIVCTLLHAVNGFLVLLVVLFMGFAALPALLTTLIFVIHPLQVESVAWISSQKTLLSALFSLLTFITYIAFAKSSRRRFYWASLIFCLLALLSKPTATPLPLLIYFLDKRFRKTELKQRVYDIVPFAIPAILQAILVFVAHRSGRALATISGDGIWPHSVIPFVTIFLQLKKLLFPNILLPLYPPLLEVGWHNPAYLVPALSSIIGILSVIQWRKKFPTAFFLAVFFITLLLPTINILPLISPLADRYMYLPMIAPTLLASVALTRLYDHVQYVLGRIFLSLMVVLALGMLFLTSRAQMDHWRDSAALWNYVIRKVPTHGMAHIKLADYYYEQGDIDRAIEYDLRGIGLGLTNPYFAKNLVAMYLDKGELDRARESALSFLSLTPLDDRLYIQLGVIETRAGSEKAEDYFKKAIEINPQNAFAWYELGRFYLQKKKDVDRAYQNFLHSISLNPYEADFHVGIAACLSQIGDYQKSIAALKYALSLDENNPAAWLNLSYLLEYQGDKETAALALNRAFKLNPKLAPKPKEDMSKQTSNE